MTQHTFIGLDVHARSVAAGLLDAATGEVKSCSAPSRSAELVPWLRAQGESISVAYEAGPTGFGLARACAAAQIPCLCLLYTSDAADDLLCVDLGGRRIIKK